MPIQLVGRGGHHDHGTLFSDAVARTPLHSRPVKSAVVLLAALATVLTACGDDDDAADAPVVTSAGGDATAVAGDVTTPDGGTAAGEGDAYCAALAAFKSSREEFRAVATSESSTPDKIETAITQLDLAFRALLDVAPAAIQGDLGAIAGPTEAFIEALDEVDYDPDTLTTANAAAAEALNQLRGPDYTEATESVDAHGLENCGITVGDWQAIVS